jgi:hypothetical protein
MRKLLITLVPAVLALGLGADTAGAASGPGQSGGGGIAIKPTVCIIDQETGVKKCSTTNATPRFGSPLFMEARPSGSALVVPEFYG